MTITASALRNNIYRLLDNVANTGQPLFIERKGQKLKVICDKKQKKLSQLPRHNCINGNSDELIHTDWSGEWNNALP
jgi:hypothetical protein